MKHIYFFLAAMFITAQLFPQAGNALNFDGNNDYVVTSSSSSLGLTNQVTMEAWLRTSYDNKFIVGVAGSDPNWGCEMAVQSGGYLIFSVYNGAWRNLSSNPITVNDNNWHHVTAVYDGVNLKLYIDGALVGTLNSPGSINTGNPYLTIGRHSAGILHFNGELDEVRVWNTARTQTQIQDNRNTTIDPSTAGLIAYYRFDQGTAGGNNAGVTTLDDLTPNNNDGTLNNFALNGSTSNWVSSLAPLPVELSFFTGRVENGRVILNWQTATEVQNYGFEVEQASSSTSPRQGWEKIGFVSGAGNSNSPHNYSFTDQPTGGTSFSYRLKQIDNDGHYKYYDAITVTLKSSGKAELMQNSPNPFNPTTAIKFFIPNSSDVTIKIYDMLGREVTTLVNNQTEAGYHIVYWNGRDSYGRDASSGVYLYRLTVENLGGSRTGSFSETKKMLLMK